VYVHQHAEHKRDTHAHATRLVDVPEQQARVRRNPARRRSGPHGHQVSAGKAAARLNVMKVRIDRLQDVLWTVHSAGSGARALRAGSGFLTRLGFFSGFLRKRQARFFFTGGGRFPVFFAAAAAAFCSRCCCSRRAARCVSPQPGALAFFRWRCLFPFLPLLSFASLAAGGGFDFLGNSAAGC